MERVPTHEVIRPMVPRPLGSGTKAGEDEDRAIGADVVPAFRDMDDDIMANKILVRGWEQRTFAM